MAQRAKTPGYNTFYNAPTVIIISGDAAGPAIQLDCALAAENIALAAEALNIGSCVMTSPGMLFASEEGVQMKEELGIPSGYNFVCAVTLGYKDGERPAAPERNRDVITFVK